MHNLLDESESVILIHLSNGLTLKQIAQETGMAYSTIRTAASGIYNKLWVTNAAHAVAWGFREGILK